MSCKDCEKRTDGLELIKAPICYYRIGTGNIALIGCEKHLKMAIKKLNK